MTFEKLSVLNGQTTLAWLVFDQYWTVTTQKKIRIVVNRSFLLKKIRFFLY